MYGLDPNQQYLVEIDSANATVQSRIPVDRPRRFLPPSFRIDLVHDRGRRRGRSLPTRSSIVRSPGSSYRQRTFSRTRDEPRRRRAGWRRDLGHLRVPRPSRANRPGRQRGHRTWRPDGPPVSTNIVAGGGDIWALYDDGSAVMRLSAAGEVEATGKLAGGGESPPSPPRNLWVAMDASGGVWKLDRDASVRGQIRPAPAPRGDDRRRTATSGSRTLAPAR